MSWCATSRMKPFVKLARSLRSHMEGILGYYRNYTTSAAIEAINGLLQLARRRERGYRRFENFRAIAYWIAGSLKIDGHPNTAH
jgi:transposase